MIKNFNIGSGPKFFFFLSFNVLIIMWIQKFITSCDELINVVQHKLFRLHGLVALYVELSINLDPTCGIIFVLRFAGY